jgi:hypothetical protein
MRRLWVDYRNRRTVATLDGLVGLVLDIRRCHNRECPRYRLPYRPEAEGRYALPQHEFGLDVIALVGASRYAEHRSVPEIHQHLVGRGLGIAERTVTNLLDRRCWPPKAVSSSPSMACSRTSVMRSSGCCATASAAKSSWPAACYRRAKPTWRS